MSSYWFIGYYVFGWFLSLGLMTHKNNAPKGWIDWAGFATAAFLVAFVWPGVLVYRLGKAL